MMKSKIITRVRLAREFLIQFYLHPYFRGLLVRARFIFFKCTRGINTFKAEEEGNIKPKSLIHNLSALKSISGDTSMRRMNMLIGAVTSIELASPKSKILVIGPRTENDILILHGFGYKNVIGLDLISYSPLVILGDMHNIPFPDNYFDIVICGWTISYSSNPKKAAFEMQRVINNNGLIGIGLQHANYEGNLSKIKVNDQLVDLDPEGVRINSTTEILDLFNDAKFTIFFNHDAPLKKASPDKIKSYTGLDSSLVMIVFSINKQ